MKAPLGHTLVIRPGALGDGVLTLPALHALRLAGAASTTVLGSPARWGFLRTAHEAPRVRDFSSAEWLGLCADGAPFGAAARATLARTNSAVVYLHGDTRTVEQALRSAGVQQVLVADPPRLVCTEPRPCGERTGKTGGVHAARRLLEPLVPWVGAENADAALAAKTLSDDVFLALDEMETARALERLGYEAPPRGGFVAVHPGSGGRRKCWPAGNYARLVAALAARGLTPLVFFGPADEETRVEFEAEVQPAVTWECVACRPLREVLALVSCVRGFIGNDAGVTHLAARACPVVALFGPTDPAVWTPLGKRVTVLQAAGGDLGKLSVEAVAEAAAACMQRAGG